MIEECPYWPIEKFADKKLAINDLCGSCGKQTRCNFLKRMLENPDVILSASGKRRKPRPKVQIAHRVVCKDCGLESIFCRCRTSSGFRLEKK